MKQFLILIIFIMSYNNRLYADNSCSDMYISPENKQYLENLTIYKDVVERIYIPLDQCSDDRKQISICIANENVYKRQDCKAISMIPTSKISIGDIDSSIQSPLKDILLYFKQISNTKICVVTPTSRGLIPVVCRLYLDLYLEEEESQQKCSNISKACYKSSQSKSPFNFSGQVIQCLQETLDATFLGKNICGNEQMSKIFYKHYSKIF